MRTRTLLLIVFGLLLALVIGRGALSYSDFNRVVIRYGALLQRNERIGAAIARVAATAVDLETGMRGWLVTNDPTFLEPSRRAAVERAASLDDLERAVDLDRDQVRLARRLRAQLEDWQTRVAQPLSAPEVFSRPASERMALVREGKARMDDIRATLDEMSAWLATRRAAEAGLVASYREQIAAESWSLTMLVAGVLAASAFVTVRFIERPLAGLLVYANQTARGELGHVDVGGVREILALSSAMKEMAAGLAEERERERRLTELMTALSAGATLAAVASVSLRLLVTHQRATAGVLWVTGFDGAQRDSSPLELAASQAVDVGTLPRGGDVLAREVRASGEVRFLDDLRDDAALVVRTAFVDAIPRALVVAPVRAGNKVVGVVELAGKIRQADLPDLLRSLERVGLALENAMTGERLAALGEELADANERLQGQNEELRVQDEELRAQGDELLAHQVELVDRNALLARASQRKSEFLSSMSHELRTPLNAVIGLADVLMAGTYGEMPELQRRAIADIRGAGKQLLTLVNDSLDLSKIEAGRLEVHADRLDLAEPARDACALIGALAMRKQIRFHNGVNMGVFVCRADRDRTRQVLVNLLSNAVKFTPEGGSVTLSAKSKGGFVRVEIADTGVGIAPKDTPRLFQPFAQLEATRSGGTGLGLSISKRLVELMGGEIGLVSEPQKGSTFFFTLPVLAIASTVPPGRPSTATLFAEDSPHFADSGAYSVEGGTVETHRFGDGSTTDRRVLVIDDSEVNRRVVKAVLTSAGYDVAEAADSSTGLALAHKERPSVVLMDMRMPGMDGLTVTRALSLNAETQDVAVIAVSSQGQGDDRERALAAGCVAFVNKPIARQELLRAVEEACRRRERPHS